ncbi:DUF542 domain-containing protein [Niallia sp. 03133]|uniref:DUF542 domain-containing protein n=1 Tax=Niallia sp. 03133 TaxID=3458060 RepID=UPI00404517E8
MDAVFTEQSIIRDIVALLPKATDILKSYEINFCCGGNRQILTATTEANLPTEEILTKLNSLYNDTKSLAAMSINNQSANTKELIDYIRTKHHRYLIEELPQLSPYLTKMLRAHGAKNPHIYTLHSLFHEIKLQLEQQIIREDTIDFPQLLAAQDPDSNIMATQLQESIETAQQNQANVRCLLNKLREQTNQYTPPEGSCATQRVVHKRLEDLESEVVQFFDLESSVLFPKVMAKALSHS